MGFVTSVHIPIHRSVLDNQSDNDSDQRNFIQYPRKVENFAENMPGIVAGNLWADNTRPLGIN